MTDLKVGIAAEIDYWLISCNPCSRPIFVSTIEVMEKLKTTAKKSVAALNSGPYVQLRSCVDHGMQARTLKIVGPYVKEHRPVRRDT
jgi:hypothetical protein